MHHSERNHDGQIRFNRVVDTSNLQDVWGICCIRIQILKGVRAKSVGVLAFKRAAADERSKSRPNDHYLEDSIALLTVEIAFVE